MVILNLSYGLSTACSSLSECQRQKDGCQNCLVVLHCFSCLWWNCNESQGVHVF